MPRAFLLLGDLLQTGLFRISDRFIRRWGSCARESFLVIATSADASGSAHWRVDLAARTVAWPAAASLAMAREPAPPGRSPARPARGNG